MPAKCDLCNRTFKTKAARADHRRSTHANSNVGGQGKAGANSNVSSPQNRLPPPVTGGPFTGNTVLRSTMAKHLGVSADSQTWAMRALHPCDEASGGGVRIPDLTTDATVALEDRYVDTIKAPTNVTTTWDLQVLSLPFPECPVAWRRKPSEASWDNGSHWVGMSGVNILPALFDRPIGTVEPVITVQSRASTVASNCTQFRSTFQGVTIHMVASSLNNGGNLTAGQWGVGPDLGRASTPNKVDQDPSGTRGALIIRDIPTTSGQIVAKCPSAAYWPAKHGVYLPMRFRDAVHLFQGTTEDPEAPRATDDSSEQSRCFLLKDVHEAGSPPDPDSNDLIWQQVSAVDADSKFLGGAGFTNLEVGVVILDGLAKEAPITIKFRMGLQAVPASTSPWSPFVETAPVPDETAMKKVALIQRRLPMAFEAKFNDLGLLLSAIASAAPWLIEKAGGWLSKKVNTFFEGAGRAAAF